MKDEYFLYQHKEVEPETKSHSVKMDDLKSLRHHAIDEDRSPCYVIEHKGDSWFMVSAHDFILLKAYKWELEQLRDL